MMLGRISQRMCDAVLVKLMGNHPVCVFSIICPSAEEKSFARRAVAVQKATPAMA